MSADETIAHEVEMHHQREGRGMWRHACISCGWSTPWHGPDARRDFASEADRHVARRTTGGSS